MGGESEEQRARLAFVDFPAGLLLLGPDQLLVADNT